VKAVDQQEAIDFVKLTMLRRLRNTRDVVVGDHDIDGGDLRFSTAV
jgi:hypothetical protein